MTHNVLKTVPTTEEVAAPESSKDQDHEEQCRKIVVLNLPPSVYAADLEHAFNHFGEIVDCSVSRFKRPTTREWRNPFKYTGFVEFKTEDACNAALRKLVFVGEARVKAVAAKTLSKKGTPEAEEEIGSPFAENRFKCCREGACANLTASNIHLSLVAFLEDPHPGGAHSYSRAELVKLNPRKSRMRGHFTPAKLDLMRALAPDTFPCGEPFKRKGDLELLDMWEKTGN